MAATKTPNDRDEPVVDFGDGPVVESVFQAENYAPIDREKIAHLLSVVDNSEVALETRFRAAVDVLRLALEYIGLAG
jgi:hypothetical protein